MPDYRAKLPKILWGPGLANVLNVGYPLDNVKTGHELREGSSIDRAPSGSEDTWKVGTDYLLSADITWIPKDNTAAPLATGWDGAAGFDAFLEWARDKNVMRFYPDAAGGAFVDCILAEPMKGQGDLETDGTRRVSVILRRTDARFDGY
jgi:hypothetical protein